MGNIVDMTRCPFCDIYWINPLTEEVCSRCVEPYNALQTVMAVHTAVEAVDQLNLNKLTNEHKAALRAAFDHLDSILQLLDRYPKVEEKKNDDLASDDGPGQ